jgi:DEAD/DEAH box helicase domain-containing protein
MQNPGYILDQAPEAGAIDPDNLVIRVNQAKCAAFELPFEKGEAFGGDGDTQEILEYLEKEARILRRVKDRWFWMSRAYPAERVSLHAGDMDNFVVIDEGTRKAIGEVDRASVMSLIHTGAIYGHQGEQYLIMELDYAKRRALASRVDSDYYTESEVETEIRVHHLDHSEDHGDYGVHLGEIGVTKTGTLYKKIRFYTRENIGTGPINLPSEAMHTEAFFLTIDPRAAQRIGLYDGGRAGSFYGLAHLFHRVVPLYVRCNVADLGVKSEIQSTHFMRPAIIIYDEIPGGVGLSEATSRLHRSILEAMRGLLVGCSCSNGCPCCIDPPIEGAGEHKATAMELVDLLLASRGFANEATEHGPATPIREQGGTL